MCSILHLKEFTSGVFCVEENGLVLRILKQVNLFDSSFMCVVLV